MKIKYTLLSIIAATVAAMAVSARADSSFTFTAAMRSGSLVTIGATVFENPNPVSRGKTVLALHGLTHTAVTFGPQAAALFAGSSSNRIDRVVAIDMPGHGASGYPFAVGRRTSKLFGDLTVTDNADITVQSIIACIVHGMDPSEILAHSMSGLTLQVAQTDLLKLNLSLSRLGITKAVLLGSSLPSNIFDPVLETGFGTNLLSQATLFDPGLGYFATVDRSTFLALFFTDLSGSFVPGTPSPDIITGYGCPALEPLATAKQVLGVAAMRPAVSKGAFAPKNGTVLRVVFGSQDGFSDPTAQKALYEYLTGDPKDKGLIEVPGPTSVHDQYIADPEDLEPYLGL